MVPCECGLQISWVGFWRQCCTGRSEHQWSWSWHQIRILKAPAKLAYRHLDSTMMGKSRERVYSLANRTERVIREWHHKGYPNHGRM